MSSIDQAPCQMRIRLKCADVQTFIESFATHVSKGGIFLASRTPQAIGTLIRFELLLADGKTKLLRGEGVVNFIRDQPHGMGLKLTRLDGDSRRLIDRIDAFKKERGVAPPIPPPRAAAVDLDDADLRALLDADAPSLDALLARARAIAHALTQSGATFDGLEALLAEATPAERAPVAPAAPPPPPTPPAPASDDISAEFDAALDFVIAGPDDGPQAALA
jgi:molecular chaperone DnaK